jgi:hypothetical protein
MVEITKKYWAQWNILVLQLLWRLMQENCKFKANLSNIARPCLKNRKKGK